MEPFAIVLGVISCIQTLRQVIDGIRHTCQFKQECSELGEMVALLLRIIETETTVTNEDPSVVEAQVTALQSTNPKFEASFTAVRNTIAEIHQVILKCQKGVLQRGIDVFFTQKVARLKKALFEWITVCTMSNTISIRKDLHILRNVQDSTDASLRTLIKNSNEIVRQQTANFNLLEAHLKNQQQNEDEVIAIRIAFRDGDPRLHIIGQLEDSDGYRGTLKDVGPVVCMEVKNDETRGEWGSRHTEIYKCISNGTFVQAFYGIAEFSGKRFAVMQDLTGNKTLATAIQSHTSYERLASLRFAYELAHAIAYLHSVGIVIKNLSDTNVVVLELEGGRLQPCLTNLEQARRIVDATAFEAHDARFEAAEYQRESTHSTYSDIWSLGVLLWEWFTRTFPFSISPATLQENQDIIRRRLAKGDLPWADDAQVPEMQDVYMIVRGCWNRNSQLRPQARYLEQRLLDLFAHWSINDGPAPVTEVPDDVKDSVLAKIETKRKHHVADDVPSDHAAILHDAALSRNDVLSSSLLGAAVWWELVPVDEYRVEGSEYLGSALPSEVERARVALSYLQPAADAGVNLALRETALAYAKLARYYTNSARGQ